MTQHRNTAHMLPSRRAYYRLRKFEIAVREDEMKGSYHPDDRFAIGLEYKRQKRKLLHFLAELEHSIAQE